MITIKNQFHMNDIDIKAMEFMINCKSFSQHTVSNAYLERSPLQMSVDSV